MKIAILTDHYPNIDNPHVAAFIHLRAKLYKKSGYMVEVIIPNIQTGRTTYTYEGIPVILDQYEECIKYIKETGFEVLAYHTPNFRKPSYKVGKELHGKLKVVCWIHGAEALYTSFYYYHSGINKLLAFPYDYIKLKRLRTFLDKYCDSIVYVSEWMKLKTEQYLNWSHRNSHVIPNPIDTDKFRPYSEEKKVDLKRGISIRSLDNEKYGPDVAIEAYKTVTSTQLTIVGTGKNYAKFISEIESHNIPIDIINKGFDHEEIPRILNQYDYFVAPSRAEAQGVAMCEAMACGLPAISTTIGGIPEFVRTDYNGILVPPDNPEKLRVAIKQLVSDDAMYKELAQNARESMLELCSHKVIVKKELEVMKAKTGSV